jgi:hypothetical protein
MAIEIIERGLLTPSAKTPALGLGKKLPADFFTSNLPSRKNIPCTHVIYRLFTSNLPHHMIEKRDLR